MTVYFTRLRVGHPKPLLPPPDNPASWKLYTICTDQRLASCTTRADVRDLQSAGDQRHAQLTYQNFQNRVQSGFALQVLYDEKQCHETHAFTHKNSLVKIFRLRTSGDIRVNFIYLNDKKIIILKTWAKRKDKLSEGDQKALESLAKLVIDCDDAYDFSERILSHE